MYHKTKVAQQQRQNKLGVSTRAQIPHASNKEEPTATAALLHTVRHPESWRQSAYTGTQGMLQVLQSQP